MALMGSWNGFEFEVSPTAVRGFTGLTIKGGSETEDKVSDKSKYVQRTNSAITEIALSVYLNAYMGCNVRDEATSFISAAMEGAQNYFYVGGKKLVTYKLMLTNAEVTETEIAPDGTWIACKIGLTMKQCEKYGSTSSSGSSGSSGSSNQPAKQTVKNEGFVTKVANAVKTAATGAIAGAQALISNTVGKIAGSSAKTTESTAIGTAVQKAASVISSVVASVKKVTDTAKIVTTTTKKTTTVTNPATKVGGGGKSQITMTTMK